MGEQNQTVLVVGGGGREHALAERLLACASVAKVVACPGNPGMRLSGIELRTEAPEQIVRDLQPDLVVIGPEAPLCDGLSDRLRDLGALVFGPSQAAAQLEASKAFMKEFAARHQLPTARHYSVRSEQELDAALAQFAEPPVVKADGLCAGKGVVVAESQAEARSAAMSMLSGDAFGVAGRTVVLEERLEGQEVSVHAISDGQRTRVLPAIQDHKRIGEGDTGPNTGGMGTYGPAPAYTPEVAQQVKRQILDPLVAGMAAEGRPYIGTIFAGLMVSPVKGPQLLEINVRFGDPETQVLMNLLDGDLAELLASAARGELNDSAVSEKEEHGMCVILASAGYPDAPRKGDVIRGISAAIATGAKVYHAGTALKDEQLVTAGGRVLGVTATGRTLREARDAAYAACDEIAFDGMQLRRDIGYRAL